MNTRTELALTILSIVAEDGEESLGTPRELISHFTKFPFRLLDSHERALREREEGWFSHRADEVLELFRTLGCVGYHKDKGLFLTRGGLLYMQSKIREFARTQDGLNEIIAAGGALGLSERSLLFLLCVDFHR